MTTYAEQQAELEALRREFPPPMVAFHPTKTSLRPRRLHFTDSELHQMKRECDALRELVRTGWLPEREEAK